MNNCPKCNSKQTYRIYNLSGKGVKDWECGDCEHKFQTHANDKMIAIWAEQKSVRPDKVEDIKAIWNSPKFKTHNQRLVHLLRHCKKVEYGYTLREFIHGIYPEEIKKKEIDTMIYNGNEEHIEQIPLNEGDWEEYYGKKYVHQIFRRFRLDFTNHEIQLAAMYKKLDGQNISKWYYYNIIEDEEAVKEAKFRDERCVLGLERAKQELEGIAEMSEKDLQVLRDKHMQEIEDRARSRQKKKSNKQDDHVDIVDLFRKKQVE